MHLFSNFTQLHTIAFDWCWDMTTALFPGALIMLLLIYKENRTGWSPLLVIHTKFMYSFITVQQMTCSSLI